MSSAKGAMCTDFSLSHHLVYGTNLSSLGDVYTIVDNRNSMVHLARSDVQSDLNNAIETQPARGMGITRSSGKASSPPPKTYVGAEEKRGHSNGNMAQSLRPSGATGELTKGGKVTQHASVFTKTCTRHGLHYTTQAKRNTTALHRVPVQQLGVVGSSGKRSLKMRFVQKSLTIDWDRVRLNLHASRVSEEIKSAWYSVIHALIQTTNA